MIDLSDIPIIDFHMHHFSKVTLRVRAESRAREYISLLGVTNKEAQEKWVRSRTNEELTSPYYQSLMYYIARTHHCNATVEEVDRLLEQEYRGDYTQYIRRILDRENIELVQFADPKPDFAELPPERSRWAFRFDDLINLIWTNEESISNLDEGIQHLQHEINEAVKKGCASLKNTLAYTRSLSFQSPSYEEARMAFREIWAMRPLRLSNRRAPIMEDETGSRNLKIVQDYLLKKLMIMCGEQGLCVQFHTGGGLAPTDIRNCNPLLLYDLFYDKDILNAGTKIVLLHASVPFFSESAIAANSFPHVYLDLSWPVRVGIMNDVIKQALAQVSPMKIVYGTDSLAIADRLGLGAWLFRKQLTQALNDMREEGWDESRCHQSAEQIMRRNAESLMRPSQN